MAEESFPFQELVEGDRTVSAPLFAKMLGSIRTTGVIKSVDNELAVTESSPQAMSIDLDTGAAFVGLSELRSYRNTLARTLTIAAADPTNPRHDLLVLDMDTTTSPDTRRITALIVQGTPAASPVDPTLTVTEAHYQIALARVVVGAAATSITNSDIADLRTYSSPANSSLVAGLTPVGSKTTEATMNSTSAADLLTVPISPAITAEQPILIVGNARKTTGAAAGVGLGIKFNTTIANEAVVGSRSLLVSNTGNNIAGNGSFLAYIGPRVTNYLRGGARISGWGGTAVATTFEAWYVQTADIPTAAITSIVIRGISGNASVTLGCDEVFVYTLATS